MAGKRKARKRHYVTWTSGRQEITERTTSRARNILRAVAVAVRTRRPVRFGSDGASQTLRVG